MLSRLVTSQRGSAYHYANDVQLDPQMPGLADVPFLFLQIPLWTSEPVRIRVYHSLWVWKEDSEGERETGSAENDASGNVTF